MAKTTKLKPMNEKQITFIRKAFMIPGVSEGFFKHFEDNFIYCEKLHSFVHRCYDQFKLCENHKEAKFVAGNILDFMRLEYLSITYNTKNLKEEVEKIKYVSPIDRLKKFAEENK